MVSVFQFSFFNPKFSDDCSSHLNSDLGLSEDVRVTNTIYNINKRCSIFQWLSANVKSSCDFLSILFRLKFLFRAINCIVVDSYIGGFQVIKQVAKTKKHPFCINERPRTSISIHVSQFRYFANCPLIPANSPTRTSSEISKYSFWNGLVYWLTNCCIMLLKNSTTS